MSSSDLDDLRHRFLFSPADPALALAFAQGLRRAGHLVEARSVCISCLSGLSSLAVLPQDAAPQNPAEGFLRGLLWSLPLPADSKARPWAVVGVYPIPCTAAPSLSQGTTLGVLPDSASNSGGPCIWWKDARNVCHSLDLTAGTPLTPPWLSTIPTRFDLREVVADSTQPLWIALGARSTLVWSAPDAPPLDLSQNFSHAFPTQIPGQCLLLDPRLDFFTRLTAASPPPSPPQVSAPWYPPERGRFARATIAPDGCVVAVNIDGGLCTYEAFGTRRPPTRLDNSSFMSFRTQLSRDGSRAFSLNAWERVNLQTWNLFSASTQQHTRFTTNHPSILGWSVCPRLQTLALWTRDGVVHLYDIDSGSPIAHAHLCDPPHTLDLITFDPQTRFALCASWTAKTLWLLA